MIVEIPQLPLFAVKCDTCGDSGRRALNREAAMKMAELAGWEFEGDKCMCHRCVVLAKAKT